MCVSKLCLYFIPFPHVGQQNRLLTLLSCDCICWLYLCLSPKPLLQYLHLKGFSWSGLWVYECFSKLYFEKKLLLQTSHVYFRFSFGFVWKFTMCCLNDPGVFRTWLQMVQGKPVACSFPISCLLERCNLKTCSVREPKSHKWQRKFAKYGKWRRVRCSFMPETEEKRLAQWSHS